MKTITLKSLQRIESEFNQNKALTKNSIAMKLGMHYYAVSLAFVELEKKGVIKKIDASSKGELFIKI